MIFRRFFALLFALAMALAPLGMPAMAKAATQATHHGEMAGQGHCDQRPQPDQHHKASDKSCCVGMCVAVVAPSGACELRHYHAARERPASDLDLRDFLGEIATPPPKRS